MNSIKNIFKNHPKLMATLCVILVIMIGCLFVYLPILILYGIFLAAVYFTWIFFYYIIKEHTQD